MFTNDTLLTIQSFWLMYSPRRTPSVISFLRALRGENCFLGSATSHHIFVRWDGRAYLHRIGRAAGLMSEVN